MNFMNLPEEYAGENSQAAILPIAYEKNLTYGRGASRGPDEIIAASKHLEYYDDELNAEPFEKGIFLVPVLRISNLEPENAQERIFEHARKYTGKFCIGIGGDHSVTAALVKAQAERHSKFSVLIFDAHPDLRYSWNGSKWNHACVARRLAAQHKVGIVGTRAMDKSELNFANGEENVTMIRMQDVDKEKFSKLLDRLEGKVYISIDVDVFDPSLIRNTGTPEPGGMQWEQLIQLLKHAFNKKEIIGCDIVEFAPNFNYHAESYALAKLIYKLIGYKFNL